MLAEYRNVHLENRRHVDRQVWLNLFDLTIAILLPCFGAHNNVTHVFMNQLVIMVAAVDELSVWQPWALNTVEVLKSLHEDTDWNIDVPQNDLLVYVLKKLAL